ncbi:MAG: 4-hydroxy-tetrahydrodipicolinate synthase, partial [Desulfohalobiaceae bacterium]
MELKGAITALATPFQGDKLDEERFREHIEWQIEQGVDGLLPCGTTGESATLSHQEHKDVIRICIDQTKGRVPVLAGAGSNSTREAVELTAYAKEAGADAALLITPYYNKPTQAGLFAHYRAIAREVSLPQVVYNVPGRTGINLLPETLARMQRDIPEVIGVKEASGN